MADLKLYSNAEVYINSLLLAEEASVTVEKKSGLNPVFTVAIGLAGMTQGAATAEVTIESAVPSADFEFNPDGYMQIGEVVDFRMVMASRETNCKGFITDATFAHGVNDASKLTMKLLCRFSEFE
jgi:hypothetical protein